MPITLVGLQALSVEIATTVSILRRNSLITRTIFSAPSMFVRTASYGKYSQAGTCFRAAALTKCQRLQEPVPPNENREYLRLQIEVFVQNCDM